MVADPPEEKSVTTHEELAETFGSDNVLTLAPASCRDIGAAQNDTQILTSVGIPRSIGPLFTTEVEGSPPLFAARKFIEDGEQNFALILGGPQDNAQMRYYLNVREGFVGLIDFYQDAPQAEIVNTTLADFVYFLHRFGKRYVSQAPKTLTERRDENEALLRDLHRRDRFALRNSDTWWSMAITRIRDHDERMP